LFIKYQCDKKMKRESLYGVSMSGLHKLGTQHYSGLLVPNRRTRPIYTGPVLGTRPSVTRKSTKLFICQTQIWSTLYQVNAVSIFMYEYFQQHGGTQWTIGAWDALTRLVQSIESECSCLPCDMNNLLESQ